MSQTLLIDCHKIISSIFFIKIGWKNAKSFPKTGIITSKQLKKRSKFSHVNINNIPNTQLFSNISGRMLKVPHT